MTYNCRGLSAKLEDVRFEIFCSFACDYPSYAIATSELQEMSTLMQGNLSPATDFDLPHKPMCNS